MLNTLETKTIHFSPHKQNKLGKLTRRQLLKRGLAIGGGMMVGSGFLASSTAAWALETKALEPRVMATLVQLARDIYPHDRFGDELYAIAVKGHDDKAAEDADYKMMIEAGIANLDAKARAAGHDSYLDTGWEKHRVAILRSMESDGFFQNIRGGLVVSLYNQPKVWELLGYEGSSVEKGGYLDRGFDDIDWL
ncbi:MAG: Twin-arginine translocation pathway signal [Granulosicoccus sp.]|nr:Twin-arginine translocation pathway signal [Granulosicoccus sp.]